MYWQTVLEFCCAVALTWITCSHADAHAATLALNKDTVHFGYFSKELTPKLTVKSGDTVVVEMATHHACDDWDKMIKGDAGMESVFTWKDSVKNVDRRGAKGTGDGVHVLTGPIFVEDAEPGDILKVEIVDLVPRANPDGKTFGSNANAWWGFQARVPKADGDSYKAGDFTNTPGHNDEVITIYELKSDSNGHYAEPSYQFHWPTLTDPDGEKRNFIQYPGTCVPHDFEGFSSDVKDMGWTKEADITYVMDPFKARIPVNMHVGCMGLAPASHASVDSIPPMPSGGNLDNKRIGKGTTMYYPVEVAGALLSMGDAHLAQGDSELDGTGIETSITGTFKLTLVKKSTFTPWMTALNFPLGETADTWIVHGFTETDYLETYSANPADIYGASDINKAMKNSFTQTRKFLMLMYELSDAEATTYITQGVDFGMTQLVDGNWGVHAIIPKSVFVPSASSSAFQFSETSEADLKLSNETVHFGYFSKELTSKLTIQSGDTVKVEMATHHACDDWDKMIKGDAGMESVFTWSEEVKNVARRGSSGTGDGVHVLTGPIFVQDAEPGDILKVEIVDLEPRKNPDGKTFGSNAAAWWGFQARVPKADGESFKAGDFTNTPGHNDEVITIYELKQDANGAFAEPSYQFHWPNLTDPDGVKRNYIKYPGTCVPHDFEGFSSDVADMGWTKEKAITYVTDPFKARIPVNMHVGCMGLAPASHASVDSIPPMPSGGNLDNKRIGTGTTMYYPVEVAGALLSMGDAHMAQGDSELDGTGIETSITGTFKITLVKKSTFTSWMSALNFPLGETADTWIVHGFTETDYLDTYSSNPGDIYGASDINKAMKNAFTQTRKFLMLMYDLSDAEATTIITQGVDFGMTQLVDGNWGVHAIIPKSVFASSSESGGGDVSSAFHQHGKPFAVFLICIFFFFRQD